MDTSGYMSSMQRNKAFTLIELLIVLGLIMVASSVMVISSGNNDGVALKSSQRIVSSIAQGARGQAILKQTPTRILIYADRGANRDEDKYLRFFGIITQDPENPNKWVAATKGNYLSKGIFFMPKLTAMINGGQNSSAGKMRLEYPRLKPQVAGTGEEYFYYEYNLNGTMAKRFINAWLLIGAGALRPNEVGNLDVAFDDPSKSGLKSGLIFRRVGSTSLVTDPNQIEAVIRQERKR